MLLNFFQGFCMALADSVPGVSGGTVAFILGFYEPFLNAVHSLFGKDSAARRKHRSRMLWLILGLMMGSLVSISAGPTTLDAPRLPLGPNNFSVLGLLLGIVILLGLEGLKKLTQKQEHFEQAAFMDQDGNMETL